MAPMAGETKSGDLHLVESFADGMLFAVIDGLGHGDEAEEAARFAYRVIQERPSDPVVSILERCHQRMVGFPRGAVITLASLNPRTSTLSCAGIGNVEGFLFRQSPFPNQRPENVIPRRGVVGSRLPPLQTMSFAVAKGDTLILATDGIRRGFECGIRMEQSPQEIADAILAQHTLGTDDALVLVARCGDL